MIEVSSTSLLNDEAYTPGLPRDYVAQKYGISQDDVAKLGSAENPFGPSPKAMAAIEEGKSRIDIYPEWTARLLRTAIAEKYGFDPDCVVCGSGETEVISFVIRAFARDGDPILLYEPCFPIYHIFAENEGRAPVYVPMGAHFDAFDPAIAPGTGTPEVGGLSYEQARRVLELVFAENRVVGFDLVEVNPAFDPSDITALLAVQVLLEAAGFLFSR